MRITPGTATPGISLVAAPDGSLSGLGALSCSSLTVNGSSIVSAPTYVLSITPGTAAPSKALVLDSSSNITNIGSLSATTLSRTIQTANQPNITSVNVLNIANHDGSTKGLSLGGVLLTVSASEFNYLNVAAGTAAPSCALVLNSSSSISGINSLSATTINATGYQLGGTSLSFGSILTTLGTNAVSQCLSMDSTGTSLTALGSATANQLKWWGGTANTEYYSLYRSSDTTGMVIASTQSNPAANAKSTALLNLISTTNANSAVSGVSATSMTLLGINWNSKQGTGSTFANQTQNIGMSIGTSQSWKGGYPGVFTIVSSTDAICLNPNGSSNTPTSGCLYIVGGTGSTAPDNMNKLLFNTATQYTDATLGSPNCTINGNMYIKTNNAFSDGSTSTNSVVMGTYTNNDYRLMTNNSSKMIIQTTGRVGIGTMTPFYGLHCTTTVSVTIDSGASGVSYFKTTGGLVSTVGPLTSVAVGICCSGALVASTGVYCWSDERLKKDWAELSDGVADSMLTVKPKLYRYKTDPDASALQYRLLKNGMFASPTCAKAANPNRGP
ncbi:hypothetical protein ON010_g5113 [Phytophthora cinnamomi]|nr:hypothetical protein ON010_g5113 [Phytophthora cinnamomi]